MDTHNQAEHTVYQMEKSLTDLGDKVSDAEKEPIKAAIENLKEVNKGSDVAAIKTAIEEAQKAFYPVAEKLYQQANPQGDPNCGGDCGNCGSDGVVDADYETVD